MMKKCVKIGEGVYGEVFRSENRKESVALKVRPGLKPLQGFLEAFGGGGGKKLATPSQDITLERSTFYFSKKCFSPYHVPSPLAKSKKKPQELLHWYFVL